MGAASSSTRGAGRAPRGPASSCKGRAVQSRQARPEEAQEPSWGAAQGALCPCGEDRGGEKDEDVVAEVVQADGGVGGGDERGGGVGHVRRRLGRRADERGGGGNVQQLRQQAGAARSSRRLNGQGMVIGGFAGGSLEHPKQWLGAQWHFPELPGAP